jgi:hypothetical protein
MRYNIGNRSLDNPDPFVVMRSLRNSLLRDCDWTQLADAPVDREAWAAYRQALRDFPATWEPGPVADFPNPPGYVEPTPEPDPEPTPEEETPEE